jgi:uncharacterized delta-60 repeat protein
MTRWFRGSVIALCTGVSLIVALPAWAAPGSLDLSFSGDGKVATSPPAFNSDHGEDAVVQADGKVVVVGLRDDEDIPWTYTLVARYLEDGTPDPDFGGGDGLVTLPLAQRSGGFAVELLSDQRIAIGGYVRDGFDFAFAAFVLTTAGELDTSFDGDGVAVADFGTESDIAFGIDVDASDGIVVAGRSDSTLKNLGLVRFTATGAPDTTFSGDGKHLVLTGAYARDVEIRPNGKIVAVGTRGDPSRLVVVRFLANGLLDTTFSADGVATTSMGSEARAVSVQPDGKIVIAGRGFGATADFVVARFLPRGRLDATFHRDGVVRTDFDHGTDEAFDVEIQPNGKIIAVGFAEVSGDGRFGIVRYRTSGRRDLTFSGDGRAAQVRGEGHGSALDEMSRLVVSGPSSGGALTARYLLS